MEAEVRHDGHDDAAGQAILRAQVQRGHRHELVAVDDVAVRSIASRRSPSPSKAKPRACPPVRTVSTSEPRCVEPQPSLMLRRRARRRAR